VEVLVAAVDLFAADPSFSLARLIAAWQGSSRGRLIEVLAREPHMLDEDGIQKEFVDVLAQLRQRSARNRMQELLQGTQQRELSPAERAELEALSRQLSRR
jgi:hypothetical protein